MPHPFVSLRLPTLLIIWDNRCSQLIGILHVLGQGVDRGWNTSIDRYTTKKGVLFIRIGFYSLIDLGDGGKILDRQCFATKHFLGDIY